MIHSRVHRMLFGTDLTDFSHRTRISGNTCFIAISTLTSEMNFYTKLISKIDMLTNKPVFKSIQISLACQACIDAEKTHECLHMQHLIPRWQDADKHRRLKIIMSDRPDLINSEMGGVAFSSIDQCFKQALLKKMFEEEIPLCIDFSTQFFVTVDPAAGGEHSDFALVSFTVSHGIYKVSLLYLCWVRNTCRQQKVGNRWRGNDVGKIHRSCNVYFTTRRNKCYGLILTVESSSVQKVLWVSTTHVSLSLIM